MKKIPFLIIPLLLLFGCCTVPSTPNLPAITIEQPPQVSTLDWKLYMINGIPEYAINSKDALKLYLDIQKVNEYMERSYNLIMPEPPK